MRKTLSAAFALSFLGGLVATARAEVDVQVPATFKAKGTLDPGETERYRFHAEQGTVLTLSMAAAKGSTLDPEVFLVDGVSSVVPIPAEIVVDAGGKVQWKGFVVPATDDYQLVLEGAGSGGYSLSLKARPKAAWTSTLAFPGTPTVHFLFSAPKGSTVALSAKPAKGSPVVARFGSLESGSSSTDLSTSGRKSPTGHATTIGPLEDGGDYDLAVVNSGAPGDVLVAAKVKPPKTKPGKIDLRGVVLGRPSGGETLVARTIGASGGTVAVADDGSDLYNAAVVIPPGVLPGDTTISVGSAAVPPLGSPDVQAAGPAVDLQPSGITFSSPVTVTLPFDFTKIPAGSTAADITIRIVEENGSATVVQPDSVDAGAGTVTVATNGFSVCIPIIPPGPPSFGFNPNGTLKPGGDEFWFAGLRAEFQTDGSGNDSRYRTISLEEGALSLYANGTLQVASQQTQVQYSNGDIGGGQVDGTVNTTTKPNGDTVGWAYGADGQTIEVTGGGSTYPIFAMSRDGSVLSSRPNDSTNAEGEDIFAIRKPSQTPSLALAAGNYQGAGFTFNANSQGAGSPADFQLRRNFGTMTLGADGSISLTFNQRIARFDSSTGQWSATAKTETVSAPAGSVVVEAEGTLLATFPPKNGETLEPKRIYLGRDFKGGFLTHASPQSGGFLLFLFTREGSGLGNSTLNGTYRGGLFDPDIQSYHVSGSPGFDVADFDFKSEGVKCTLTGGATGTLAFHDHHVRRDTATTGGVDVQEQDSSAGVSVAVTTKGKVTFNAGEGAAVGSVAPDGSFIVLGTDVTIADGDYFLGICVQSPPLKP